MTKNKSMMFRECFYSDVFLDLKGHNILCLGSQNRLSSAFEISIFEAKEHNYGCVSFPNGANRVARCQSESFTLPMSESNAFINIAKKENINAPPSYSNVTIELRDKTHATLITSTLQQPMSKENENILWVVIHNGEIDDEHIEVIAPLKNILEKEG